MRQILQHWFFKWVLAPIAVLCTIGWAYFQINYPTCTFRYKLTAEVMTPEGLKTGSSVLEVSYHTGPRFLPDPNPRFDTLRGEAVYVDLGQGKNLFVTLGTLYSGRKDQRLVQLVNGDSLDERSDYQALTSALNPIWLPIKFFSLGREAGNESEMCARAKKFDGGEEKPVPTNNLPTLITFSDLHNPLIARIVNPSDLAATFGAGYSLLTKIQITTDSISDKMYETLPWLKSAELEFFPNNKGFSTLARWNFYKFKTPGESSYLAN
jgi:hypothetical protein